MESLVLHPTDTAQWHALVSEAEYVCHIRLNEELESYLVFLLVRFAKQPELAASVLAMEFFHSVNSVGRKQQDSLRALGDKCLLLSGLFPGCAQKRLVSVSYFVDLGQTAYSTLSNLSSERVASLFSALCESFVSLMDVLQTMRETKRQLPSLMPLEAAELWNDTGSSHALAALQHYSDATLIRDGFTRAKSGKMH